MDFDPSCVFQGSLLVIIILMDGSENAIVRAAFELKSSHVCEKRSKKDQNLKGSKAHLHLNSH